MLPIQLKLVQCPKERILVKPFGIPKGEQCYLSENLLQWKSSVSTGLTFSEGKGGPGEGAATVDTKVSEVETGWYFITLQ